MEIFCVEPIYPQYLGVFETCLALRYWFFEVLGSESAKRILMTICMCVGLYDGNQHYVEHYRTVENAIKHFTSSLSDHAMFKLTW